MKKKFLIVLFLFGIVMLVWIAVFSWKNLRGIGPTLRSSSSDIATLIERASADAGTTGMPLTLPPGFSLSVFAKGLGDPRVMVLDPDRNLLVSIPAQGRVVALPDTDRGGIADRVTTVIDGLKGPHGLAFSPAGRLYIAEENAVYLCSYDRKALKAEKLKKIAELPAGGGHATRTLLFLSGSPEDRLLISVGSSCNVCLEDDWRRAKILSTTADGRSLTIFASGLRNSVFMAVHPRTKEVWATEMGRDLLGDNLPPDEINIIKQGRAYGGPFCYGKNVHDSDFDRDGSHPCKEPESFPSHIDIPAHSAPLGLAFFPREGWPAEFRDDLLVAYHGSWNRSIPTGYKIVRFRLDDIGRVDGVEDFMSGWLTKDGTALGRPVDILILPDETIFVSDDKAGVIYRITRDRVKS
jgi:glucose/arabinose dehydrogenase